MGPEILLGIPVGKNLDKGKYWESIINKIKRKIAPWRIRSLSYIGKMHVLKSIGISNILYGCEMIVIDEKTIKEVNDLIWEFIWEQKTVRFKRGRL